MIDVRQAWHVPDRRSITSQWIGTNPVWDIIFAKESGQEGLRRFGVPMPLEENVEHEPVLVHGPPKPVSNAVYSRTHLVQMPPGTPTGFPVAQVFREEESEFHAPLAERFMADLNATLVQQSSNISVDEREALVQPNCMLDDAHWKLVAVGFRIGHGGLAYPDLIKATQPLRHLVRRLRMRQTRHHTDGQPRRWLDPEELNTAST